MDYISKHLELEAWIRDKFHIEGDKITSISYRKVSSYDNNIIEFTITYLFHEKKYRITRELIEEAILRD